MEYIQKFKNYLFSLKPTPSKITVKNYSLDVKHFIAWLESKTKNPFNPSTVSLDDIASFRTDTTSGLSIRSLDRHVSSLRKFFHFLKLQGIIPTSPFENQTSSAEALAKADPYRIKEFKDFLYVYNASNLTIKNYIIDVKQFLKWAQAQGEYLDSQLIARYRDELIAEKVFSASSINRKLSSLRKYMAWAKDQNIIKNENGLQDNPNEVANIPSTNLASMPNSSQLPVFSSQSTVSEIAYSPFPPFRLAQKISKGINLAFESVFIAPLAHVALQGHKLIWTIKGKPLFHSAKKISAVKNISKRFPWYEKMYFHAKYTRPNWYKRYHSYALAHYFNWAILMIVMTIIGFGFYNSFVNKPQNGQHLLAAAQPNRILSFQGRLTDNNNNPITTNTNLRFAIYNDATATGSALQWQEVDNVTPDANGVFSVLLGKSSGIPQSLFANNANLYLGITVGQTPELTPRQQLATVAYATNAETLQGLPPITQSGAGTSNVVLALNSSGNLSIGAASTFQTVGGAFTLSGDSLVLNTNTGTNGNVAIAPDGQGFIDLQKPLINSTNNNNIASAQGSVEVDDTLAILATNSGVSAVTINQNGTAPILSASSGGVAKFTIGNAGDITDSHYTTAGGIFFADANGLFTQTTAGTNGQCLTSTGGTAPTWGTCGGASTNYWTLANGALYPVNTTLDAFIGGTATSSAKFSFLNVSSGTPTASVSSGLNGTATFITANGTLQTTNNQGLTLGGTTTGNITIFGLGTGVVHSTAGVLSSSAVNLASSDVTGILPLANGGTGTNITGDQGGLVYFNSNTTLTTLNHAATAGQCLISGGTGAPSWTSCSAAASNWWNVNNGALYPINDTFDLLLGGSGATTSAKFAVLNMTGSGTPTASVSSGLNGSGTFITSSGTLQTTNNQGLTLGGTTTGSISFANNINSNIIPAFTDTYNLGSASLEWNNLYVKNIVSTGSISGFWQRNLGVLAPTNITDDLTIGGVSTNSAKFQVFGNTGNATTAGTLTFTNGGSQIQTTSNQPLTLGGNSTGNIILEPNSGSGIVTSDGNILPGSTDTFNLGSSTLEWNNLFAKNIFANGQYAGFFQRNLGVLSPTNITDDIAVGGTSTTSAKFQIFGNTGNATTAGNLTFNGNAVIAARNNTGLTIGDNQTGNITVFGLGTGVVHATSGVLSTSNVSLTSEVTGILPLANGGTNANLTADNGGIVWSNASQLQILAHSATVGQCLLSGGSATPTWGNCTLGGGQNWFNMNLGTLFPINQTLDLTLGSSDGSGSSASAKFAVLNMTGAGTPTASVSSGLNGSGTYITANGTLQTTNFQGLTIGGTTTGNITLSPQNGNGSVTINGTSLDSAGSTFNLLNSATTLGIGASSGTTTVNNALTATGTLTGNGNVVLGANNTKTITANGEFNSDLIPSATNTYNLGSASLAWNNLYVNNIISTGTYSGFWQRNLGVLSPTNITDDFAIGGTGTSSAKFQIFGNTGNATTAGTLTFTNGGSQIQTTSNQALTLGGNTTGGIILKPNNGLAGSSVSVFADLLPDVTNTRNLGSSALAWNNVYANNIISTGTYSGFWQRNLGALSPTNITDDLLIGGTATSTAKFAFYNNTGSGIPTASISAGVAGATYLTADGNLATTANQSLTLSTTGTNSLINLNPSGTNIVKVQLPNGGYGSTAVTIDGGSRTNQPVLAFNNIGAGAAGVYFNSASGGSVSLDTFDHSPALTWTNRHAVFSVNNNAYDGSSPQSFLFSQSSQPTGMTEFVIREQASQTGSPLQLQDSSSNVLDSFAAAGNLGIGTSSPLAALDTRGLSGITPVASFSGQTSFAATVVNNDGIGDLFTASASSQTRFIIGNNGTLTDTAYEVNNGILYGTSTGVISQTAQGASHTVLHGNGSSAPTFSAVDLTADVSNILPLNHGGTNANLTADNGGIVWSNSSQLQILAHSTTTNQCLLSGGSATPTWGNCTLGGGQNWFNMNLGTLFPINQTLDLTLGSSDGSGSSASAKFAVLNMTGAGTPTASVSSGLNGSGTYITANGTLQTTSNQGLTIGGATTGNITIAPLNSGTGSTINLNAKTIDDNQATTTLFGTPTNITFGGAATTLAIGTAGAGTTTFRNNTVDDNQATVTLFGTPTNITFAGAATTLGIGAGSGTTTVNNAFTATGTLTGNGNVVLGANNTKTITANGEFNSSLIPSATNTYDLGTAALEWNNLYVNNIISGGTYSGFWQRNLGALSPSNITDDLLAGGTGTTSAKFAVLNMTGSGNPTASVSSGLSGNGMYFDSTGELQTVRNAGLTIGGNTTGNITLNPLNNSGTVTDTGNLTENGTTFTIGNGSASTIQTSSNANLNINTGSGVLTLNNSGSGNLQFFSASNTLTSSGNLTLAGTITLPNSNTLTGIANAVQFNNGLTVNSAGASATHTNIDTSGNILPGTDGGANLGSAALEWNNVFAKNLFLPSSGGYGGYWQLNAGTLSPANITNDIAVGGTSTSSAKFQVFGNTGNATTSGNLTFNGNGQIQTTNDQTLTFGGNTTGNLSFASNTASDFLPYLTDTYNLGSSSLEWNTIYVKNIVSSGNLSGFWQRNLGTISPANITDDILAGGTATTSAKFAVLNMTGSGTPTASVSSGLNGNGMYFDSTGRIQTVRNQGLTIGGNTTGNITLSPLSGIAGSALTINAVNVNTTETSVNLLNTTATTINFGGATTSLTEGAGSGTTIHLNATTIDSNQATLSLFATPTTINEGAAGQTVNFAGNTTLGTNNTNTITANGEFNSSLIPNANNTYDLGTNTLAWRNLFVSGNYDGFWQRFNGEVSPYNLTDDLLLGSTATTSAKFAVLNIANGNPTASVSSGLGGTGMYFDTTGQLQTVRDETLTLGGNTTGNISFGSHVASSIFPYTTNTYDLGSAALQWNNIYAHNIFQDGQPITQVWQRNLGTVEPLNITDDVLAGGTATTSAKFAVLNMTGSGTPTASVSSGLNGVGTYITANGTLQTTSMQPLTIGGASTGPIQLSPKGTTGLFVDGTGNVGIGTTSPATNLQIAANNGSLFVGDNTNTAAYLNVNNRAYFGYDAGGYAVVQGVGSKGIKFNVNNGTFTNGTVMTILPTGFVGIGTTSNLGNAQLVINQTNTSGLGDIITASSSGTTKWLITNGGTAVFGSGVTDANALSQSGITVYQNGLGNSIAEFDQLGNGDILTASSGASTKFTVQNDGTLIAPKYNTDKGVLYLNGTTGTIAETAQGASNTVLHGNASGIPTFSAVDLTADVSNILPLTHGGTGANITGDQGGIVYFDTNTSLHALAHAPVVGECLLSGGTSAPSWSNCGSASSNWWNMNAGTLFPINQTFDLTLGSSDGTGSSASAKFAVLNMTGSGTPTASVSSGLNGSGTFITANGTLQTTSNQGLTLGGISTGNITLSPLNGGAGSTVTFNANTVDDSKSTASLFPTPSNITLAGGATTLAIGAAGAGTTTFRNNAIDDNQATLALFATPTTINEGATGQTVNFAGNVNLGTNTSQILTANALVQGAGVNNAFQPVGNGVTDLGSTTHYWGTVYATNFIAPTGGGTSGFWQLTSNVLSPVNFWNDLAVGGNATGSATPFQVFATSIASRGIVAGSATTSGSLTFFGSTPTINTTSMLPLTIGGATTGPIQLSPKGTTGLYVDGSGNVGIGTTSPTSPLFIAAASSTANPALDIQTAASLVGDSDFIRLNARAFFGYDGTLQDALIQGIGGKGIEFNVNNNTFGSGTEMVITSGGNVGIGTTNPIALLNVTGTASVSGILTVGNGTTNQIQSAYGPLQLNYKSGFNSWSQALTIQDTTGNIGIGTTNPVKPLQLSGSSVSFELSDTTGGYNNVLQEKATGGIGGLQIQNGSGSLLLATDNTNLRVGIGTASPANKLDVLGAVAIGTYAGTNTAPSNGLIISGNVGIGTTAASDFNLEVQGNVGPQATDTYNLGSAALEWNNLYVRQIITPSGGGIAGYWQLNNGLLSPANIANDLAIGGVSTSSATFHVTGASQNQGTLAVASVSAHTSFAGLVVDNTVGDLFTASSSGQDRFVIKQNGNVGIGIDSPANTLQVAGDFQVGKDTTNWGVAGYSYRRQITIDQTASNTTQLTNYQVKIVVDTATLISAGKMLSNCNDIRFTDTNGSTNLNYWIENGCNTNYTTIWVKTNTISGPQSTIYMYYGNTGASAASSTTGTFVDTISNVQAAYRLDEPTYDPIVDYSTNGNVATASGTTVVTGKFNNARSFNGTSDYIAASNSASLSPTAAFTASAWFNTSQSSGSNGTILREDTVTGTRNAYALSIGRSTGGHIDAFMFAGGTANTLTSKNAYNDGNWHYAVMSFDGTKLYLSIDNQAEKPLTVSGTYAAPNGEFDIGAIPPSTSSVPRSSFWQGSIDETRVYNASMSALQEQEAYGNGSNIYGYVSTNNPKKEMLAAYTANPPTTYLNPEQSALQTIPSFYVQNTTGNVALGTLSVSSTSARLTVAGDIKSGLYDTTPWGSNFSTYSYRARVNVDNTKSSTDLTNYIVQVTTNTLAPITNQKMRTDCGDIRFADADGNTNLSYWIETGTCNTASTVIDVKVPTIPGSASKNIYMYYGNPAVVTTSSTGIFTETISGVKGAWRLDETSGSTATDYSGNSNTGTVHGTVIQGGYANNSRYFNGTGTDYITAGNPASLQIAGALTLEAWVKTSAAINFGGIVSKMNGVGPSYGYTLRENGTGLAEFGIGSGTGTTFTAVDSTTVINDGKWHHIVGVYVPSTSLKIYVDGALQNTNSTSIPSAIFNSTGNVTIGCTYTDGSECFNGNVDEVRIYNTSLAASDITNLYNARTGYGYVTTNSSGNEYVRTFNNPEPVTTVDTEQDSSQVDPTLYVSNEFNRVGVGTANPETNLDIVGTPTSIGYVGLQINDQAAGGRRYLLTSTDNNNAIGGGNFGLYDNTAGAYRMVVTSAGNVGIGTTNPVAPLEVAGSIYASSFVDRDAPSYFIDPAAAGTAGVFNGNVGIGTTSPGAALEVDGSVYAKGSVNYFTDASDGYWASGNNSFAVGWFNTGGDMRFRTNTSDRLTILGSDGSVGIGTTGPLNILHVSKDISPEYGLTIGQEANAQLILGGASSIHKELRLGFDTTNNVGVIQATVFGSSSNTLMLNPDGGNVTFGRSGSSNGAIGIMSTASNFWVSNTAANKLYFSDGASPNSINNCSIDTSSVLRCNGQILQNTAPDIAENIPVTDTSIAAGDIVSTDPAASESATKTKSAYDPTIVGVISTNPGITLGHIIDSNLNDITYSNQRPLVLGGRVPVKVSTVNGPINIGDPITSSSLPGFGMKATKAGQIVAKAYYAFNPNPSDCTAVSSTNDIAWTNEIDQQNFTVDPDSHCYLLPDGTMVGKVIASVQVSYYDPDVNLTTTGDIAVNDSSPSVDFTVPHYFTLNDALGNPISRMGAFVELVVGNLRVGSVNAQQLFTNSLAIATDNVSIAGQSLHDYIAGIVSEVLNSQGNSPISPIAQIDELHTNLISPLASNSAIAIDLTGSKFTIRNNASGSAVATIDNTGNATFSGTLNSQNLAVNGDATVSGTLHAGNIEANNIIGLNAIVSTLSAQNITNVQNIYFASPSGTQISQISPIPPMGYSGYSSTNSAVPAPYLGYTNLASYSGFLAYVPNLSADTASLGDTSVTGQLSVGAQLILADNSINVLGDTFQIQPLRQGGVSFEGGLLAIDTDGNLTVNGNAVFSQTLAANIISPISNDRNLNLQLGQNSTATGSALATSNLSVQNASGSGIFSIDQLGNVIASGAATIGKLNLNVVQPALAVSDTEQIATGSAGTAFVKAHQTEITIDNKLVTNNSLIYITPVGSGSVTPYLLRQVGNSSFTVGIPTAQLSNTTFNWLIVN